MYNSSRDILVLLRDESMNKQAIEQEIETLNRILTPTESIEQFCLTHELVDRNNISSKSKKILLAIRYKELRPFRFLICKN
jgi:hypothetical protein